MDVISAPTQANICFRKQRSSDAAMVVIFAITAVGSCFALLSNGNAMAVPHAPKPAGACFRKAGECGAPVLGLLAVQPAEPPQCGAPPAACHAGLLQPTAVLVPPLTSPQHSPGATLNCDCSCALYVLT